MLGVELFTHSHRFRLVTQSTFGRFVKGRSIDFFDVGGKLIELMAYMVQNPGLLPKCTV